MCSANTRHVVLQRRKDGSIRRRVLTSIADTCHFCGAGFVAFLGRLTLRLATLPDIQPMLASWVFVVRRYMHVSDAVYVQVLQFTGCAYHCIFEVAQY